MTTNSDLKLLKRFIKFNSSKYTSKKVPSWTKNMSKISLKRGAARRTSTWKTGGRRRRRTRRRRRHRARRSRLIMNGGRRRRRKISHLNGSFPAENLRGLGRRRQGRKSRMPKWKGKAVSASLLLGKGRVTAKQRVQPNYMSRLENYRRTLM